MPAAVIVATVAEPVARRITTAISQASSSTAHRGMAANLDCAQLPVGADAKAVSVLPRFDTRAPELDRKPWPSGERNATAKPRGTAAALKRTVADAFDTARSGDGHATTGVVVLQDGKIVAERYRMGFGPHVSQRTWSVAKSLAGALIGVAVHEGVLDAAIIIDHLQAG